MNLETLYNPGNVVCNYLNIHNDHRFILRLFVNLTYYGHIAVGLVLLYSRHINF